MNVASSFNVKNIPPPTFFDLIRPCLRSLSRVAVEMLSSSAASFLLNNDFLYFCCKFSKDDVSFSFSVEFEENCIDLINLMLG